MEEKKSPEFRIMIGEEHSDHLIREEKKDIRIEKLNQKITIISIVFPCIILILLIVIYFDIKNKITGVHDSGSMEVKNLSADLDKKTADLSLRYAKLEESLEKKAAALKNELLNFVKNIDESKAEKKETAESIVELNRHISAVKNELASVSSKIKGIESGLLQRTGDISKNLGRIENDLAKLHSDIAGISALKTDKKDIEASLRAEQKRYQGELSRLAGDTEDKLESVRRQIAEVEKRIARIGTAAQTPKTENTAKPAVSKGTVLQPGKIIEQYLQ